MLLFLDLLWHQRSFFWSTGSATFCHRCRYTNSDGCDHPVHVALNNQPWSMLARLWLINPPIMFITVKRYHNFGFRYAVLDVPRNGVISYISNIMASKDAESRSAEHAVVLTPGAGSYTPLLFAFLHLFSTSPPLHLFTSSPFAIPDYMHTYSLRQEKPVSRASSSSSNSLGSFAFYISEAQYRTILGSLLARPFVGYACVLIPYQLPISNGPPWSWCSKVILAQRIRYARWKPLLK